MRLLNLHYRKARQGAKIFYPRGILQYSYELKIFFAPVLTIWLAVTAGFVLFGKFKGLYYIIK